MFENMFDFGNVKNFLDTMTQVTNQKAAAAKEVAQVAAGEKAQIADSATRYEAEAQKALTRLGGINTAGEDARAKAESNNIIDRVTLIGDQILNPRNYTAKGREAQIGEMSQSLAMQGQIHSIEVNASMARIQDAEAKATMKTAGVDATMSALRAQVDGLALMNNAIAQTETLRQSALAVTDLPTLTAALAAPPNPEAKGKIVLNGMSYTPYELKERQVQLENREKLAMLAPSSMDPDFMQKIKVHHDMQLANYSLPDLMKLKTDGYVMPDGTQVEPGLWDAHYNRQNQLQQDALQTQMNAAMLEQQVPAMLQESQLMAQNVKKYAQPGTPLAIAQQNFNIAAEGVARLAAADVTPMGKSVQITALNKAQEGLVRAVEQEAVRKAGGDKALAEIFRSQMLGYEIQPAQVEDVVKSRYVKGAGFGEILPNESALRVRKNADNYLQEAVKANAANFDSMAPNKSQKELKEEAIGKALEQERQEAGIVGINTIQRAVVTRKDNPAIKAGLVPGQLNEITMRSSAVAEKKVMDREGLSLEQLLAIKAGRPANAGITNERAAIIAESINVEAVQTEYDLYEQQRPGLGYEMQQWLQTTLPEMAQNYTANMSVFERTLAGDGVSIEAQRLAQMYTLADESATERSRKMAAEIATGARKPENMWPVLLHMQKQLGDSQKQAVYYDIVQPAIAQARSLGGNDETVSNAVFEAMTKFKSDDPTLMSAVKTMQRGLPDELDRFHTMWATIMSKGEISPIRGARVGNDPELAAKKLETVLPWLKK